MKLVEFGRLTEAYQAELEGDEKDPYGAQGNALVWRDKDRHVGLRAPDGRLAASAGLVLAEVQIGEAAPMAVVGIGGVIVAARHRGQGLGHRVISEILRRATTLGPTLAMLFCLSDRAGLYARHEFVEVAAPVVVQQPGGPVEMPYVTMWRALRAGAALPPGRVIVHSFPF